MSAKEKGLAARSVVVGGRSTFSARSRSPVQGAPRPGSERYRSAAPAGDLVDPLKSRRSRPAASCLVHAASGRSSIRRGRVLGPSRANRLPVLVRRLYAGQQPLAITDGRSRPRSGSRRPDIVEKLSAPPMRVCPAKNGLISRGYGKSNRCFSGRSPRLRVAARSSRRSSRLRSFSTVSTLCRQRIAQRTRPLSFEWRTQLALARPWHIRRRRKPMTRQETTGDVHASA
jgi:hypothetical protein